MTPHRHILGALPVYANTFGLKVQYRNVSLGR